jgi:hypothetical protein
MTTGATGPEVTPQLGITPGQFNQYYAGGVFKQVSDADTQGPGTTYDQYAAGGTMGQLRVVCGSPVLDQYAAGGIWVALAAGAA